MIETADDVQIPKITATYCAMVAKDVLIGRCKECQYYNGIVDLKGISDEVDKGRFDAMSVDNRYRISCSAPRLIMFKVLEE